MLTLAVLLGFSAFAITEIARKWGPIEKAAMMARRPWGCDGCMSFWATLVVGLGATICARYGLLSATITEVAGASLPGSGICLLLLYYAGTTVPKVGEIPELQDLQRPRYQGAGASEGKE